MDNRNFEKALLYEKQCRFKDAVLRTSKNLGVSVPKIKFWEGYCPDSQNFEVAHIHVETRTICISNYRLRSMNYDEIDGTAVHETTHLIEANHSEEFQKVDVQAREDLWKSRNFGDEINSEEVEDVRTLALKKFRKSKKKLKKA